MWGGGTTLAQMESYGTEASTTATGAFDIVVDFGGQVACSTSTDGWCAQTAFGTGAVIPDETNSSTALTVVNYMKAFAAGYASSANTNGEYGWIDVGTNNSITVSTTAGTAWASLVDTISAKTSGDANVHIQGANDIESSWNGVISNFALARDWVGGGSPASIGGSGTAGFQTSSKPMIDYGNAVLENGGLADTNWTDGEFYNFYHGWAGEEMAPEMYYSVDAPQYQAVENAGPSFYFAFVLSSEGTSLDPAESWADSPSVGLGPATCASYINITS